jgi:hypothetical protein
MEPQNSSCGCGFVGRGWAIVFAKAGYEARLYAAAVAEALAAVDVSLSLISPGLRPAQTPSR